MTSTCCSQSDPGAEVSNAMREPSGDHAGFHDWPSLVSCTSSVPSALATYRSDGNRAFSPSSERRTVLLNTIAGPARAHAPSPCPPRLPGGGAGGRAVGRVVRVQLLRVVGCERHGIRPVGA